MPSRRHLVLSAAAVLGAAVLSGCTDPVPLRTSFPPLAYDYLTPLRLNVGDVEVREQFVPGPGDLGAGAPVPPVQALRRMASDRIKPGGSTGRAVFVINDASMVRSGDALLGNMAVELDIVMADGSRTGFAEARVQRRRTGLADLRGAEYDLVHDMMDDMNVELEFQVRRSLKDWLQVTATAPLPAAVQQQDLSAPATSTPPATPGALPPPRPVTRPSS